jgi:hypothetical protein
MIAMTCPCGGGETFEVEVPVILRVRRTAVHKLIPHEVVLETRGKAKIRGDELVMTQVRVDEHVEPQSVAQERADLTEAQEVALRIAGFEAAHRGEGHEATWTVLDGPQ